MLEVTALTRVAVIAATHDANAIPAAPGNGREAAAAVVVQMFARALVST
jgi:hypothetical protein